MRVALVMVTCLLIAVSFPHALEDFHYGDLLRLGIPASITYTLLATAYALQLIGIAFTLRGSASGVVLLGVMGAVWCLGALFVHGRDLLFAGAGYRHGMISRALESLIIVLGMFAAALAVRLRVTATA
ncbi:MAG: hypothetical protein JO343_07230 [Candidatus Eremiobacteraeota bacterium]|nr:hypothetical protein [Candidatus Eremiobacteraeota bacterium]